MNAMGRPFDELYGKESNSKTIRKLQAIKICPVTSGLPTTMTLEGFQAACERSREADRHNYDSQRAYKYTWCDTCQGKKMPRELRIVSLDKLRAARKQQHKKKPENARTFSG